MPPFLLSPLARALRVILIGTGISFTCANLASAQTSSQPQQVAQQTYKIPAGTLAQSLNRFASESAITLSFAPGLVEGKQVQEINGSFTPVEGLQKILQGSGLELLTKPDGSYSLKVREAGKLSAVKVSAAGLYDTTEGTASYTTGAMSTATLLPLSSRETPQSVTVITRQRMEDQNMIKASDALKYTPGITPHSWSGPNREAYFSRGFAIENFTYDGLPSATTTASTQGLLNDMAIYDRVEVVRGATGLSQGTGTPSATINFVRKRPTSIFQASVESKVGQWDYYGATADVSGPLNEAASLRGRAVVSASTADSFQDVVGEERHVLYAIGEADLGENTLLTTAVSYQKNNDISTWAGIPTAQDGSNLDLPRSTFLGNDWNFWNTENTSVYASLDHQFANDWRLVGAFNYIDVDVARCVTGILRNKSGTHDLNGNCGEDGLKRTSVDLRAQGPFELFGRQHDLVVGGAEREAKDGGAVAGYGGFIVAANIDIFNWNHDAPKPDITEAAPEGLIDYYYGGKTREHGFYTTARFNITDPLKLIVGARVDWFKHTFKGDYFNIWVEEDVQPYWDGWTEAYDYDKHFTQYAGLTYDFADQATLYASYTAIFQPQNARDKNGDFIDPVVGNNYEIGIKSEFADGLLTLDAALFRIEQENLAVADLVACPPSLDPDVPSPSCSRPAGLVRSEGIDIELLGALTSAWEVTAGYTYANPKTIKNADEPDLEGQEIDPNLPRHLFKASTTYRLPGDRWRVGGGFRWQSDIKHYNNWMDFDYRTRQQAYTILDAMVSYKYSDNLNLQLNASNLLDKTYWRMINTQPVEWGGNAMYGEPRKITLTAKYTF